MILQPAQQSELVLGDQDMSSVARGIVLFINLFVIYYRLSLGLLFFFEILR